MLWIHKPFSDVHDPVLTPSYKHPQLTPWPLDSHSTGWVHLTSKVTQPPPEDVTLLQSYSFLMFLEDITISINGVLSPVHPSNTGHLSLRSDDSFWTSLHRPIEDLNLEQSIDINSRVTAQQPKRIQDPILDESLYNKMQQVIESRQQLSRQGQTPPTHQGYNSPTRRTVSHLLHNIDPSQSVRFLPPPINPHPKNLVNRLRNYISTDQARTSNIRPNHPQFNLQERIHHSTPRQNVRTSSGKNILPGINQTRLIT